MTDVVTKIKGTKKEKKQKFDLRGLTRTADKKDNFSEGDTSKCTQLQKLSLT